MTEDPDLLRVLAGLRAQYLSEAPDRMSALRNAVERARSGDGEALTELRVLLHRLAGSGGSYGLQAVTDTARAAEHEVYALLDSRATLSAARALRLTELVEGVAVAFREAGAAV